MPKNCKGCGKDMSGLVLEAAANNMLCFDCWKKVKDEPAELKAPVELTKHFCWQCFRSFFLQKDVLQYINHRNETICDLCYHGITLPVRPSFVREDDGRHEVTDRMLHNLKVVAYQQDDYGMDKYGKPLDHTYNYDWLAMALEEEADKLKYLQNEMDRRNTILNMLEHAYAQENWNLVESAIKWLKVEGTKINKT